MSDKTPQDPRTIWQSEPMEIPRMVPAQLQTQLEQRDRKTAMQSQRLFIALSFNTVFFTALTFVFPLLLERAGCVLTALGWACVAVQMRVHGVGAFRRIEAMGMSSIEAFRTNLERQRNFAAAWPWFLVAVPGPVLFFIGAAQQYPNMQKYLYVALAAFASLVFAVLSTLISRTRTYQSEINELHMLQRDHA